MKFRKEHQTYLLIVIAIITAGYFLKPFFFNKKKKVVEGSTPINLGGWGKLTTKPPTRPAPTTPAPTTPAPTTPAPTTPAPTTMVDARNLAMIERSKAKVPEPASSITEWACIGDFTSPLRYINNNVECLSYDNKNCRWKSCPKIPPVSDMSKQKPLACGEMHKAKYGMDGYSDPNHWCSKAKTYFTDQEQTAANTAANAKTDANILGTSLGDKTLDTASNLYLNQLKTAELIGKKIGINVPITGALGAVAAPVVDAVIAPVVAPVYKAVVAPVAAPVVKVANTVAAPVVKVANTVGNAFKKIKFW